MRGWLVRDFVRGDGGAVEFGGGTEEPTAGEHGRFNLLLWDGAELVFASNYPHPTYAAVSPAGCTRCRTAPSMHPGRKQTGHANAGLVMNGRGIARNGTDDTIISAPTLLFDALADTYR